MKTRKTKRVVLKTINAHLQDAARLDDPPLDYLAAIEEFKTKINLASGAQLAPLIACWDDIETLINHS